MDTLLVFASKCTVIFKQSRERILFAMNGDKSIGIEKGLKHIMGCLKFVATLLLSLEKDNGEKNLFVS
jgi:hypothetical protein